MTSDLSFLEGIAPVVAQALLNGLGQGVLLTAAVAVVLHLLRGTNAATRYAVWYATLLVVLALPLAAALSHPVSAPAYAAPPTSRAAHAEPGVPTGGEAEIRSSGHTAPTGSPGWWIEVPPGAWLVLLLGGGLLIGMARAGRLVLGLRVLRRLKRTSRALPSTYHAELEPVCAAHVRRPMSLRVSDRVTTPVTVGFLHPAVLLPAGLLEQLSREELRQIVLHELAHLRRRDDWTNLAQRLVEAVLFFHPALWWIGRRLDLERELACDAYVVAALAGERAYARCLTRLAELALASRAGSLAPGAAPPRSQLTRRVRALLAPDRPASVRISLRGAAAMLVLLAAGGAALALAAPALALVEATPDRSEPRISSPSVAGSTAPVPALQASVGMEESAAEAPASGPAATARTQRAGVVPAHAGELVSEAGSPAGLGDSPVAAAEARIATQDALPLEASLAHLERVEPTVARHAPVSPPRPVRRGVELEITLALPYGSPVGSPGRSLPTPASLGLPAVYSQERNGWPGGIGLRVGDRGLSVGSGGIRLRVTGGGAPGGPYAAPWGRW